jgi:hypothetical protein
MLLARQASSLPPAIARVSTLALLDLISEAESDECSAPVEISVSADVENRSTTGAAQRSRLVVIEASSRKMCTARGRSCRQRQKDGPEAPSVRVALQTTPRGSSRPRAGRPKVGSFLPFLTSSIFLPYLSSDLPIFRACCMFSLQLSLARENNTTHRVPLRPPHLVLTRNSLSSAPLDRSRHPLQRLLRLITLQASLVVLSQRRPANVRISLARIDDPSRHLSR